MNKKLERSLFYIGLGVVIVSLIPYFILGENAAVIYHDQLDGELIAYIYQAKYLFSGQNLIPEFLGGAAKTALTPPAPLAVLLFRFLPAFAAYVCLQLIGQVTAYVGMFFLADRMSGRKWIALITGLLYAFIPFLPVYGLCQYGLPMLFWCTWNLYEGKQKKGSLLYVAFYAAMSSLVLVGFACLGLWMVAGVLGRITGRKKTSGVFWGGFVLMLLIYIGENIPLLSQMLGLGSTTVSHKKEYGMPGAAFLVYLKNDLLYNGEHSEDGHLWILYMTVGLLLIGLLFGLYRRIRGGKAACACGNAKKNLEESGTQKDGQGTNVKSVMGMMIGLGLLILVLCGAAALWDCNWGIALRDHLGALRGFQFSRVLWLTPVLWQMELVCCLQILETVWSRGKVFGKLVMAACSLLFAFVGLTTVKASLVKPCLQQLANRDYPAMSYRDYLAIGVMDQVEEFLAETEGVFKDTYRVASLGIDPAAALYQGFYTVDGYSNNYDLDYKHAFRKVIAPELAKSEYLTSQFDLWGNRCYLFSAEIPGYYTVEKNRFYFQNLCIDTQALQELGCDYILSASYIANAEEENLVQLNEAPIETPDSYYGIYVYKIVKNH